MASAYEGASEELRIVLLGVSGAGKSSIGNAILGREAFKETTTRESEKRRGIVEGRNISIIDTPGFFNSHLTDEELQQQMMKSLDLAHPGPHVFLLIVNLEKFEEDQRNIVEKIQEKFGAQALSFTIVLFIGREKVSRKKWAHMSESENMKELLGFFEGRFQVINSKAECDTYQIAKLIKYIDKMVKDNGGQNYNKELNTRRKKKEQKDSMKQEAANEIQVGKDTQEQQAGIYSEEDIKTINTTYTMKEKDEKEHFVANLRIVLLGKTGSGKSSVGNTLLGRDAFRASFISSTQTCEKHEALRSGRMISVIDTPGLLDVRQYRFLKEKLKREIEECLIMSAPGPHVFLLVIRLNGRHTDEDINTMKWIKDFSRDAVHRTIVLFTHVDLLKGESLDQYIRKSLDLQSLIDTCGGRFHSFNNKDRRDQNQVTELLGKIGKLMKDKTGDDYSIEKCPGTQTMERDKDTRPSISEPTSPQEKRQLERINQGEEISAQSRAERNDGEDEVTEMMERGFDELRRETDQLFRLVMDLKMAETDLRLSIKK